MGGRDRLALSSLGSAASLGDEADTSLRQHRPEQFADRLATGFMEARRRFCRCANDHVCSRCAPGGEAVGGAVVAACAGLRGRRRNRDRPDAVAAASQDCFVHRAPDSALVRSGFNDFSANVGRSWGARCSQSAERPVPQLGGRAGDLSLESAASFRKELGISDSAVVVLYSGNMNAKQGLETLLEAATRLQEGNDSAALRLVRKRGRTGKAPTRFRGPAKRCVASAATRLSTKRPAQSRGRSCAAADRRCCRFGDAVQAHGDAGKRAPGRRHRGGRNADCGGGGTLRNQCLSRRRQRARGSLRGWAPTREEAESWKDCASLCGREPRPVAYSVRV